MRTQIGSFLALLLLTFCIVNIARADIPRLIITLQHDKTLNSLLIASSIEWNRTDLNEAIREKLDEKNIFYRRPDGNEIRRQYQLNDKTIMVRMIFPEQETGRRLTASTRVELSLFKEDGLFFESKYFGQHAEGYSIKRPPEIKFRPQSLHLYSVDQLHLKVAGNFGRSIWGLVPHVNMGMTLNYLIEKKLIDDKAMNDVANTVINPVPPAVKIPDSR